MSQPLHVTGLEEDEDFRMSSAAIHTMSRTCALRAASQSLSTHRGSVHMIPHAIRRHPADSHTNDPAGRNKTPSTFAIADKKPLGPRGSVLTKRSTFPRDMLDPFRGDAGLGGTGQMGPNVLSKARGVSLSMRFLSSEASMKMSGDEPAPRKNRMDVDPKSPLDAAIEIDHPETNTLEYRVTVSSVGRLFAHQQWRIRRIGATTGCKINVEVTSDADNVAVEAAESKSDELDSADSAEGAAEAAESQGGKKRKVFEYHKLDRSRTHQLTVLFEAEDAEVRRQAKDDFIVELELDRLRDGIATAVAASLPYKALFMFNTLRRQANISNSMMLANDYLTALWCCQMSGQPHLGLRIMRYLYDKEVNVLPAAYLEAFARCISSCGVPGFVTEALKLGEHDHLQPEQTLALLLEKAAGVHTYRSHAFLLELWVVASSMRIPLPPLPLVLNRCQLHPLQIRLAYDTIRHLRGEGFMIPAAVLLEVADKAIMHLDARKAQEMLTVYVTAVCGPRIAGSHTADAAKSAEEGEEQAEEHVEEHVEEEVVGGEGEEGEVVGKHGIEVEGGGRAGMKEEARAELDAMLNALTRRIIELPTCIPKLADALLDDLRAHGVEVEVGVLQAAARRFMGLGHLHWAGRTLLQLWHADQGAVDYDMVRAMALEGVRDRLKVKAVAKFVMKKQPAGAQQDPQSPPMCAVLLLVLGRQDMKDAVLAWQQISAELKSGEGAILMYNAMLDGCIVHRHQMAADAVLKEMEMFGVKPDAFSYALLAQLSLRCQSEAKTAEYKAKLEAAVADAAQAGQEQPAAGAEEGEGEEEGHEAGTQGRGGKKKRVGVGLQRERLVPRVLSLLAAAA